MELIQKIMDMLNFLDEIDIINEESKEKQQLMDLKQQDLLHYIEFNKLKSYERTRLTNLLEEVRKERREAKDNIETLINFKSNILQMQTKAGREQLRNVLKRQKKKLEHRRYTNRAYKQEELDRLVKGIEK